MSSKKKIQIDLIKKLENAVNNNADVKSTYKIILGLCD